MHFSLVCSEHNSKTIDPKVFKLGREISDTLRYYTWFWGSESQVRIRVKVGFHYPSSRAELTARELGCIFVNSGRQLG